MSNSVELCDALKILVCYYDSYGLPYTDDGIMVPIQAGKSISDKHLNIQGDNEVNGKPCDNISDKNASYSELTALYWAWKNLRKLYPDVKYVGWTHYRRFFAFDENKFFADIIPKPTNSIKDYRVNVEKAVKILEAGKIIVAKRMFFHYTIHNHYCQWHNSEDYRTLKKVIKEKFPDYYDSFTKFMEHNNKISLYCMFIMKYDDFVKYCEWLFAVISELETKIPYQYYNPYQKRVLAFMAERLMNVYIIKNKMKPRYLNVYFYEDNVKHKSVFKNMLRYILRCLAFIKAELIFRLDTFSAGSVIEKNSP